MSRKYIAGLTLSALSIGVIALSGCESNDDKSIATAQACLDNATTAAQANACAAALNGITTQQAYLMRCSANFIAQGLTGDRLVSAFEALQGSSSGTGTSTAAMAPYLIFSSTDTTNSIANTVTNCAASGDTSMLNLAHLAQIATLVPSLAGTTIDPTSPTAATQFQSAITTALSSGGTAQIGTVVETAAATLCAAGSAYASNDVCTTVEQAISSANGDAATIGTNLLNLLKH